MTKDSNENEFRKVETYALQLVPTDLDGTIQWEVEIVKKHTKLLIYAVSRWAWWDLAQPDFGSSVNPIPSRGREQIMPTTSLLAHPDLKTQRCLCTKKYFLKVLKTLWELKKRVEKYWSTICHSFYYFIHDYV